METMHCIKEETVAGDNNQLQGKQERLEMTSPTEFGEGSST